MRGCESIGAGKNGEVGVDEEGKICNWCGEVDTRGEKAN